MNYWSPVPRESELDVISLSAIFMHNILNIDLVSPQS